MIRYYRKSSSHHLEILNEQVEDIEKLRKENKKLKDKNGRLQRNYNHLISNNKYGFIEASNREQEMLDTVRSFNEQLSNTRKDIVVLLALISRSKELVSMAFSKSRLDRHFNEEHDKFNLYLIKLDYMNYITWKLDMEYWDLFSVPIDIPNMCFKEADNITELLNG